MLPSDGGVYSEEKRHVGRECREEEHRIRYRGMQGGVVVRRGDPDVYSSWIRTAEVHLIALVVDAAVLIYIMLLRVDRARRNYSLRGVTSNPSFLSALSVSLTM